MGGIETSEMSEAISYQDTSVDGQTEVLWKDNQNRGWLSHKEYHWLVKYRPSEELASVWIGDLYADGSCCRDIFDTGLIKIEGAANEAKLGVLYHHSLVHSGTICSLIRMMVSFLTTSDIIHGVY